jgi:hypothetical protein
MTQQKKAALAFLGVIIDRLYVYSIVGCCNTKKKYLKDAVIHSTVCSSNQGYDHRAAAAICKQRAKHIKLF